MREFVPLSTRTGTSDYLTALLNELVVFTLKQANAALFGGLLLTFMLLTHFVDLPPFHRYDTIFLFAIITQLFLILSGLETRREVMVIFGFHVVATVMELYKTSALIGSWNYPGPAWFALWNVPLFAGFMYSAVGSYIARAWKLLRLRFTNYPKLRWTYLLCIAIYVNFFTHHFVYDVRYILVAATVMIFHRTQVHFTVIFERRMPLLLGFLLISFFVWIAENIATYANVWLYPSQQQLWTLVSPHKMGAWFLLMIVSFVLVSLLYRRSIRSGRFVE